MTKIESTEAGKSGIRKVEKVQRVLEFSGLNKSKGMAKGSVYCSDADGIMEFGNKYLIIFEAKEEGNILPLGQKIMLKNIVSNWVKSGKYDGIDRKAIALFVTHSKDEGQEVPICNCKVVSAYTGGDDFINKDGNLLDVLFKIGESWGIKKLQKNVSP